MAIIVSANHEYCHMLIDNSRKQICSKCKIEKLCTKFYRQFEAFASCCKTCHNRMNKANILKKINEKISFTRAKYRINYKYKFTCNNCNYKTNDKSNYRRHCLSQKHIDKLEKLKTSEILEVE